MKDIINAGERAQLIFSAMNTRDLTILEKNLAEDAVFDFPGTERITGRRKILLFLKVLFRKYPQLQFTIEEIIIDGERACVVWHNEGKSRLGEEYKNNGITFVRLSQGNIIFISDYFKDTSFVAS